jgi:hypothetical protein
MESGNLKLADNLRDPGTDGSIELSRILREQNTGVAGYVRVS